MATHIFCNCGGCDKCLPQNYDCDQEHEEDMNERLELLKERAKNLGYDIAWVNANQAWIAMDYRPYAPETAKLRAVKNSLDELEEWISSKER